MNRIDDQYQQEPPVVIQARAPRGSGAVYFLAGMAFVAFGAACVFVGVSANKYIDRLDALEKSAKTPVVVGDGDHSAMAAAAFHSRPVAGRDRVEPMGQPSTTSNNSQPQIYFMMGNQGMNGGVPAYYQQPQLPAFMTPYASPNIQTEMNQFIMARYQAEFGEYMRQRTMQAPAYAGAQAYNGVWQFPPMGGAPTQVKRDYITTDIAVPVRMTKDLKRKFSKNVAVENWLEKETIANIDADDNADGAGAGEPRMDDVLRGLAESTFADKQYERTARVYAELASRSVELSVPELLRWAKAAELAGDPDSALRILELILKIDGDNVGVLREAANITVATEKFNLAAEYYLRLMKADPEEREWRMMRAKTLTWSGRGREAVDLMRTLYREDMADWDLNLMLADLLLSLHEFEESLPLLDALIDHSPADDSLRDRKMNALMALQRFREAADMCADLLKRDPENTDLILKQAVNLVAAQEFAAAIGPFQQYLSLKPGDVEVRKQFAECLMAAQQFAAAAGQYKVLLAEDDAQFTIRRKLANAQMAALDYAGAAETYRELAMSFPSDPELNLGLVVSLRMSHQKGEALEAAKEYLEYEPYDEKVLAQAASLALENKNLKQSLGWYRTVMKLAPTDWESRLGFANALMWEMDYEQAENEFRRVITMFAPKDARARRGLARALFYQRKYKESFQIYKELTWEDPTGSIGTEYKFRQAVSNGQEVEACKHLMVLQELEPDDITWKSDRYQSMLRQHRFPEARAQARVVQEQEPSHRPTRNGKRNAQHYLTTTPVTLRGGLLRKSSKRSTNENQDRQAKLTYTWFGVHGERSISDFWRVFADVDREGWKMREPDVSNLNSYRLKLGGVFEGHPNLKFKGDLGYRWFIGGERQVKDERGDADDQWLYNLRGEMVEINGMPLNVGLFSGRREHYDNYRNVYDDLYAYDFGVDAHYRWRKWNFNAELVSSVLTDSNTRMFFHGDAKYRLYETPCMLITVGGNVEYESWNETKPTYYSPRDMYKYGIDLDGRYYFCRDPEVWGGCESYMDFGISIYRDRFKSTGQKFYLGVYHDYTRRLSAFARVDFTRESYYNELKLVAGLTYNFGGCD